jgi:hypothetical protein
MSNGPIYLKLVFQSLPDYYCLEDNRRRPGEQTERGMFFATSDHELFASTKRIFAELMLE